MTNYLKKLLASIALAGIVSVTPALARDDCQASLTQVVEGNQTTEVVKDFKAEPLNPAEISAILDSKGPPPVVEPFTMTLMTAVVSDEPIAMLIIHDGDCVLLGSSVMNREAMDKFLGRKAA